MHRIYIVLAAILSIASAANGQKTETTSAGAKTARILPGDSDFGYPMARLGDPLTLEFDILDDQYSDLYYSIQHLDSDFQPDDLSFGEYAEGFNDRPLQDYEQSFNTLVSYTHYTITIPNRDIQPTISGNYSITVYDGDNPDEPVVRKFFMLYDDADASKISADIIQPFLPEHQMGCQQIEVKFDNSRHKINNPGRYMKVYAQQNYDPELRQRLEISGFLGNEIQYRQNDGGNIFPGGNTFDFLDAKDVHFRPLYVDAILYNGRHYHYYATATDHNNAYYTRDDLHGQYYIKNDRAFNQQLESDYIDATFRLRYDPFTDYKIYLYGALTNYLRDESSQLKWNPDQELWETTITLKQGLYNYQFVMVDADGKIADYGHGSHFNTPNQYLITIYTTHPKDRGDRLLMAKVVR